ncbi:UDP-glycosyltransferase 83A1 [Platanthera zijinensis]|uniref:UDP-glycosyltransferase 83A1 n=1 Tax=Platanthera zijinensis TaxID=2320716 RepID=A0AAP0B8R5_9ASPA
MAAAPHVLVFPYPAMSHITSLLELSSYRFLDRGFKITFLNTEFNQRRLLAALPDQQAAAASSLKTFVGIRLATIPDGLGTDEDRSDLGRFMESITATMPGYLEELMVRNAAESDEERFTWFLTDFGMGWAVDIARKVGLRALAFFPMAAALLAGSLSIPKLIQDGVIDKEGAPINGKMFQLGPKMLPIDPAQFTWNCFKDSLTKKIVFNFASNNIRAVANAELILCNTSQELEKHVLACVPDIVPIGPLLSGSRPDKNFGNFWVQDTECIEWLDRQQNNSVIYAAFGSFTVFSQCQFQELAHGLELIQKPFLWVVRADLTTVDDDDENSTNLSNLMERVGDRGRIVSWCPQQKVLAHPAVACFITHCGWNSILEGVINGVPFLCWPYFADQFFNQTCICDFWRVGLRIVADESGMYSKEQIMSKLEALVGDKEIKERSSALKEAACKSLQIGGSSFNNFNKLIDLMSV